MKNTKEQLEKELFEVDKQIVDLLNQRADICYDINQLKKEADESLYDPIEELDIQEALEPLSDYSGMITAIYPSIQKYGRTLI
jgi:chorismate mutase